MDNNTFLKENCAFGFCPGCGHTLILKKLNSVLVKLNWKPEDTVVVTDIGCVGLSDQYLDCSTFHGLHGRSVTYATGLKLANPNLKIIVLAGDGGFGIGLTHFINAARRNIDITVLIFNNFNFGMTGGSHSSTTPIGYNTLTTPNGNHEHPLDITALVGSCRPTYVARMNVYEQEFNTVLEDALTATGFSLIDVWEFCTAHFVPKNKFNKKEMKNVLEHYGLQTGVTHKTQREDLNLLLEQHKLHNREPKQEFIIEKSKNDLSEKLKIVVAGAAGQKIISSMKLLAISCLKTGLYATQKNDYPITIMTGHSVTELIIDKQEVLYTSFNNPNVLIILNDEGLRKTKKYISKMTVNDCIIYDSSINLPVTKAKTIVHDIETNAKSRGRHLEGIYTLAFFLKKYPIVSSEILVETIKESFKEEISTKLIGTLNTVLDS